MVEDEELVWSYMESKIALFIENLFRGVMDLQGTESTKPAGSSLWTQLKFNHPLTKREVTPYICIFLEKKTLSLRMDDQNMKV